jgi:hypothetical protein
MDGFVLAEKIGYGMDCGPARADGLAGHCVARRSYQRERSSAIEFFINPITANSVVR